jgi:hypothetical protein
VPEVPGERVPAARSSSHGAAILVVGSERSGTSWIATALSRGTGSRYLHEPDSPGVNPLARHEPVLSRYPVLEPGEDRPELAGYVALWDAAFSGHWPIRPVPGAVVDAFSRLPPFVERPARRGARSLLQASRRVKLRLRPARPQSAGEGAPVLVKTVYALFALDWLVERYRPGRVVAVRRDPLAVAASLYRLGTGPDRFEKLRRAYEHPVNRRRFVEPLGLPPLPARLDVPESCAWWAAFTSVVTSETASQHPDWITLSHDDVVRHPEATLTGAVRELGGTRLPELERYLERSNRPGKGYSTRRSGAGHPDEGRASVGRDEQLRMRRVVELFGGAIEP